MMTRQQIRQFLAVVETGSFTRAAQQVGVAQPSLSSGIRQLEEQVGAQLFDRDRPRVRLTAAGNRLLPIARRIDREFKRAEIETAKPTVDIREFIIGVIPTVPTDLLAIAMEDGPDSLTLRERPTRELVVELRKGAIDAALALASGQLPDDVQARELWSEPYLLMVPEGHKIANQKRVAAEETADEVMIARRSCEYLSETSKFFTSHGVRPRFSFKSRNDDRAMAMVKAGLGITVAPASLVRNGVSAVTLSEFNTSRTILLLYRRDDYADSGNYRERVEALIDSIGKAIASVA